MPPKKVFIPPFVAKPDLLEKNVTVGSSSTPPHLSNIKKIPKFTEEELARIRADDRELQMRLNEYSGRRFNRAAQQKKSGGMRECSSCSSRSIYADGLCKTCHAKEWGYEDNVYGGGVE